MAVAEGLKLPLLSGFIRSSYFFQPGVLPSKDICYTKFTQDLCLQKSRRNPVKDINMSGEKD